MSYNVYVKCARFGTHRRQKNDIVVIGRSAVRRHTRQRRCTEGRGQIDDVYRQCFASGGCSGVWRENRQCRVVKEGLRLRQQICCACRRLCHARRAVSWWVSRHYRHDDIMRSIFASPAKCVLYTNQISDRRRQSASNEDRQLPSSFTTRQASVGESHHMNLPARCPKVAMKRCRQPRAGSHPPLPKEDESDGEIER